MEFDINKLISFKNREEAKIGKKYYFFDLLDIKVINGDFSQCYKGKLIKVYDQGEEYQFTDETANNYSFIYPCEEDEKNYLSYEDLKKRWLKNPTELYRYDYNNYGITGMITYFDDEYKVFYLGDLSFSEDEKSGSDNQIIANITDINGDPLIKE